MNTKKWKRGISLLLCMALLLGNFPAISFAAENDGLCEHHTEHTDCGYAEGESACGYACQICAQEPTETAEPDETTEATEPSAFTEVVTENSDDTAAPTEYETKSTEETLITSEQVYVQTENVTSQPVLSATNTISHTWDETTKTLTIIGEGPMPDYYLNSSQQYGIYPPWNGCSGKAEKIVISEGITYVGEYAFYDISHNCSNMKELVLADSVEEIGHAAFCVCPSLEKITIGKGLKAVCGTNFRYCSDLKEIHISDLSAYCGISYDAMTFLDGYAAYLYSDGEKITDLVIPDGVVEIGAKAFQNCGLNSVTLPDTVTILGQYAFAGNSFAEFEMPSGITVLNGTFKGCSKLQSIVLSEGLEVIGNYAFKDCQNLQSVTIPDTVTAIGEYAFSGCTSMKTIELSDNLTSIDAYAFSGCTSLKSIDLPANLTSMEKGAFQGCSALNVVEIPSGLTVINPMSFSGCTALTNITLPDTLTSIEVSAFYDCGSLTATILPDSVTVLGESAFKNCSSLQSIKLSESLTRLSVEVFSGCTSLTRVELPASISAIQQEAFNGCSKLTEIVFMGDAPSVIGELAFGGVKATCYFSGDNETFTAAFCAEDYGGDLTWRRIGEETDSIWCGAHISWELSDTGILTLTGAGAMHDYPEEDIVYAPWYDSRGSITQIVISEGITEIGIRAFYNCSNVTSVTIPTSITVIGDRAFEGCAIISITWPEHLNTIGDYAFSATKLSGVLELPRELVSVGAGAFAQCKSITDVVLPDSMTDIPDEMFYECSKLVNVSFPQPLKSIGNSVFSGCYQLNSVDLPEGLISIGDYAFSSCGAKQWGGYSFTSVTLPSTLKSIGKGAFTWCQSLVSISIPEGVDAIRECTFYRCEALSELTIPVSVKTIESRAFEYCYSLFTLIFCGDAPQFGTTALECIYQNSTDFMTAYYPAGNATWTEDVMQNYGGRVTWVPYEPSDGTEDSGGSDGEGTSGGDNEESGGNETEGGDDGSGSNGGGTISGGDSGDSSGTGEGGEDSNAGTGGMGVACPDGHTFGDWEETVTPDCKNTGEKRRECTVCGGCEYVTLDALGHTEVTDSAVEASCTTDGLTEGSHCSICDEIIVAQEVIPAGHTVENGVCTLCGAYGTCGENLTWEFDESAGKLTVSGTGAMYDYAKDDNGVNYPWAECAFSEVYLEEGVTGIGDYAFYGIETLTDVNLPETLKTIGNHTFENCTELNYVAFGSEITQIGVYAFAGCTSLFDAWVPEKVTVVSEGLFSGCTHVDNITLPDGLTEIGDYAFEGCEEGYLTIPTKVTRLGTRAFADNGYLSEVTIPAGVTALGAQVFRNCTDLATIKFQGDAPVFETMDDGQTQDQFAGVTATVYYPTDNDTWTEAVMQQYGGEITWVAYDTVVTGTCGTGLTWTYDEVSRTLTIAGSGAMEDYTDDDSGILPMPWAEYLGDVEKIVVENGVTAVGDYAFFGSNATAVELPEGLISIGDYAFGLSTELPEITIPTSVTSIGSSAFYACIISEIVLPDGLTYLGDNAFSGCENLKAIDIPASLTEISGWTFTHAGLTAITIPGTVRSIGENAFQHCHLESVTIAEGVTSIGDWAFYWTDLAEVTLPETITNVGMGAFCDTHLTNIRIPASVTSIGPGAFDCDSLLNIEVDDTSSSYMNDADGVLYNKDQTTMVACPGGYQGAYSIPNSVTRIEDRAFIGCSGLTQITIPEGVTYIGEMAFATCQGLTEVVIPEGVTTLGEAAFDGCSALADITIPESVIALPDHVLGNTALTSYRISDHITSIGAYAFSMCDEMTEITIPDSVTYMGDCTFYRCGNLAKVVFEGSAPEFGKGSNSGRGMFSGVTATVYYPADDATWTEGVKQDYDGTITWIPYEPEEEKTIIASGTCGDNLTWTLDSEGVLTISGSGAMDAIVFDSVTSQYLSPWKEWQDCIKSVVIESGVTDVVDQAFGSCENLETITIPATVTKLGEFAILYGPSLKEIQVDDGNQYYCSVDGVLYNKDMTTLIKYPACRPGTEYTVPDTVTKLMHAAFAFASKLVSITLPDNITVLDTDTFADCTSLKYVRLPKNLTDMEAGSIFWNCSALESIKIPDNVQVIGVSVFAYCPNLKQVTLPAGLKKLDGHAFGRCESLETITIPADVNCMQYKLFEGSGLKSIVFEGDAPDFHEETFTDITATAYYPIGNTTWTASVMQDYGGTITWVPYSTVENRVVVPSADLTGQTSVWIDGVEYAVQTDGSAGYIDLTDGNAQTMVAYTYYVGNASDVHTQYPTGMQVWTLTNEDGLYTTTRVEELDDILQYAGSSIRATGKQGIRMITAIGKAKKNALISGGLAGFALKEYGTVVAWASQLNAENPLVLGKSYAKSNYAYKKGVADPVLAYQDGCMQYTNVLVGFSLDKCKDDIAMRPYMILADATGNEITLYGGTVERSIGYIAYQNRNAFAPDTEAYAYIWEIIHAVYGDAYDAEYQGE